MKLVIVGMFLYIMFHMTAIYGGIMIGLSLLSSVSKHNMWSYYDWIYCCFCSSVNTICGGIMVVFVIVVVSQ